MQSPLSAATPSASSRTRHGSSAQVGAEERRDLVDGGAIFVHHRLRGIEQCIVGWGPIREIRKPVNITTLKKPACFGNDDPAKLCACDPHAII